MKLLASFVEQCLGSLLTFGINLWLIRYGTTEAYGVYVFWLSIAWVLGMVQGTLVIAHLFRLPSAQAHAEERRAPERFFMTVALALALLATLLAAAGDLILARAGSSLGAPAAPWFIGAFLLFQYVRAFAFSRQRAPLAACLSGLILVGCAALLALDLAAGVPPSAGRVLALTAAAYGGASALVLVVLTGRPRPMLRWEELRRHAHLLGGSGWLLLGAGCSEVTSRLYSFVVVGRFGTEALAALSAVQVVIRPAWLLSSAWASIGFPLLSSRRAEGRWDGFARVLLTGAVLPALGSFAWTAAVVMGWPFVSSVLYHGRYADAGLLPYLWGANAVTGSVAVALNTAVLSLGEYKRLALIDLCGAAVTVAAMGATITRLDYQMTIVGTVLGQITQITLMGLLVRRHLRARRAGTSPPPARRWRALRGAAPTTIAPDPERPG